MGDWTLEPQSCVIVGMTGSGKTTFALRALVNRAAACRFIFDDMGRASTRLRITPAVTAQGLETALASRWVVFNPHRMFPGRLKDGFRFFCDWVYRASCRGPGKKFFLVDEVWRFQNNFQIPEELALIVQAGREENIEPIFATQLPHKVNASIVGQCTEFVCFRLQERLALASVDDMGDLRFSSADAERLPLGAFIGQNRMSGQTLRGRFDFPA